MCLEYDGTQVKDMPSFNLSFLIKPEYFHLCCSYAYCFCIDLGWILDINDDVLPFLECCLVIIKNIESIGT
jgi:hypothetical protein